MSDVTELGLLGSQLALAMRFRAGGFDKNDEIVECQVTHDKLALRELFHQQGGVWVMRSDSLPGYAAIKAIAVTDRQLMLETSPLDWEAFRNAIREANLPFMADEGSGKIKMATDKENRRFKTVLYIGRPFQPPQPTPDGDKLHPRVLWKFYVDENTPGQRQYVLKLVDEASERDTFIDLTSGSTPYATQRALNPKPLLQLDMRLIQTLSIEQVPIMCLGLETRTELRMKQELRGVMIMQNARRLERMNTKDAMQYVLAVSRSLGPDEAYRLVNFAVAGRVKALQPGLTWKQARSVARRKLNQVLSTSD